VSEPDEPRDEAAVTDEVMEEPDDDEVAEEPAVEEAGPPAMESSLPQPEPPPAGGLPRRPHWWSKRTPDEVSMEPGSRLSHHVAYEVTQALFSGALLATLGFVALGGQFADLYLWLRGPAPSSGEVALLTIGEEALYLFDPEDAEAEVTPRAMLAELVRFLDAAGASVIVLDILLDRPAPGDDALAAAAQAHGAVVGAERIALSQPGSGHEFAAGPTPALGEFATGFANLQEEENALFSGGDLLVRRAPLVRRVARARLAGPWPMNIAGGEQTDTEIRPALALSAAWMHAHGADHGALLQQLAAHCQGNPLVCDGDPLGLPATPAPLHQPLEINFRGPEGADGITAVTAARALRVMGESALMRSVGVEMPVTVPDDLDARLRDRVVVVCRVDGVADDRFVTPYSFPLLLGADMAGGRIQAQVIDTLLGGKHVRHAGAWLGWLLAIGLSAGIVLSRRRLRDDLHTAAWLATALGLLLFGILLFRVTDGLALDLGLPITVALLTLMLVRVHAWALEDQVAD
jgi:CHASE2 domain-containing sensor protein